MKKSLTAFCLFIGLILTLPVMAQPAPQSKEKDVQMINAQLRFIMESAGLTKKEYQKFAGIYIEYNEQLAALNRKSKPGEGDYMKEWSQINDSYQKKLEKALPDTTRVKIGVAQWQLGQKIWQEWANQNQRDVDQRVEMWQRWAEANRQMMQGQIIDYHRRNQQDWNRMSEQQREWWENYWKSWQAPDSAFFNAHPEMRRFNPDPRRIPQFTPPGSYGTPGYGTPGYGVPGYGGPGYGGPGFGGTPGFNPRRN